MSGIAIRLERMGIPLTDEQRMVADAARDFATRRLAPGAAERDRTGRFPLDEVGALAELGLLAMKVPVADGGAGTDNVGSALAMEAIAEACASTAVILASSDPRVEDPRRPRLGRAEAALAQALRRGEPWGPRASR